MKYSELEKQDAIKQLRKCLKPGNTLHTIVRRVSKSGMSRRIDVVKIVRGDTRYLTWLVAKACGYSSQGNGEGLLIGGCGMDMGFEVVYQLGRTLWPKGHKRYVTGRNGVKTPETDGGYLLKQRWI